MGTLIPPSLQHRGYTLVELLVVFAIMGIVVVTAALAWRHDDASATDAQARRLASRIELAMARNQTAGRRIAVSLNERGYAFWERDDNGVWLPLPSDEEPCGASLPDGMTIEGVTYGPQRPAADERLRLSLLDSVPLRVVLRTGNVRVEVTTVDFAGRMRVGMLEPS